VPEQLLNDAKVAAVFEQMRGKAVPEQSLDIPVDVAIDERERSEIAERAEPQCLREFINRPGWVRETTKNSLGE